MSKDQQIVGFVVTPEEIGDRVTGLDNAIRALDVQMRSSKAPSVNAKFLAEWDAFQRRWGVQRDSFASWGSRLFATRVLPIVESFERTYQWWARDFQRRTGMPVKGAAPVAQTGLVPTWAWVAAVVGVLVILKGKV